MTVITGVGGIDVCRIFARSCSAVMAVAAGTRYVAVIESRRTPATGSMAVITGIAAGNMGGGLAGSN